MDYCQPCRRHLNGALACAGCGTPAEALGPYAAPAYSGHEPEPRDESREPSVATGRRRRTPEPVRGRGAGKREGRTRRARRGHRRRGRMTLLAVLGVLLAVGALGVTRLATAPEGDSGAADYVREAAAPTTGPPVPDSSASIVPPDHPAPVESPTARPTTPAADSTSSGAAKPTKTAPTEKPTAPDTPSASGSAATTEPPVPDDTDASAGPSDPVEGPTSRPAPPPPTAPAPTPEPTETCDWFLWWCT